MVSLKSNDQDNKINRKKKVWHFVVIVLIAVSIGAAAFIVYKKSDNKRITKCVRQDKANVSTAAKEDVKVLTPSSSNPVNGIIPFLNKLGWSFIEFTKIREDEIPQTFEVKNDELPFGVIWAYNNELSKVGGLDFSPYKGKRVKVYTMTIKNEKSGDVIMPCNIIICEGKIVGAWIGNENGVGSMGFGNDGMYGASGVSIEKLAEGLCKDSYRENIDKQFRNSSQQEILANYFEAINKKNYKLAYHLLDCDEQVLKCSLGEKNLSGKIFMEEKIEVLEVNKPSGGENYKWTNEFGEEVQAETLTIKANSRLNGQKEEKVRNGSVRFIRRGNSPWKILYIGWELFDIGSVKQ